jgi:hypothetical protein
VSTALVPAAAVSAVVPGNAPARPRADFLAQLIATAVQAPQTRLRRRVELTEAVTVYGAAEQRAPVRRPRLVCSL